MKIVSAILPPRGKNQRVLAALEPGKGVVCKNRTKANSMCETAKTMGIRVGTHIQEDGQILVYRKPE